MFISNLGKWKFSSLLRSKPVLFLVLLAFAVLYLVALSYYLLSEHNASFLVSFWLAVASTLLLLRMRAVEKKLSLRKIYLALAIILILYALVIFVSFFLTFITLLRSTPA